MNEPNYLVNAENPAENDPFSEEPRELSRPLETIDAIDQEAENQVVSQLRDLTFVPNFEVSSNGHSFTGINKIKQTKSSLVYAVVENGVRYALKVYLKVVEEKEENEYELKVLKKVNAINSPYLAQPVDFWISEKHVFLLSHFYEEGDIEAILSDEVKKEKYKISSANFILNTFIPQALAAVKALHDSGIIHKDIKPNNFFLAHDESGALKILLHDFGSAMLVDNTSENKTSKWRNEFSPPYKAPEVSQNTFSSKSDFFSLGMSILDLYLGLPWYHYGPKKIDPTNVISLEFCLAQGVLKENIIPYRKVDKSLKIQEIIENLVNPTIKDRWGYVEISKYLKGEPVGEYIKINVVINFKKTVKSFQELFEYVTDGVQYWEEVAAFVREHACSASPSHYLQQTVEAYPRTAKKFRELVASFNESTFKDEHYILFESILTNYFWHEIFYRSYSVTFSDEEEAKNVLDHVSRDIFEAIHNRGKFNNNETLKRDLYHFVASGALLDYIKASATNADKVEALEKYVFNYRGIDELNPLIYILSPLTPLLIDQKEVVTINDFFKTLKVVAETCYMSDGSIVFNKAAKDFLRYMEDGSISAFLSRYNQSEKEQANYAFNLLAKMRKTPDYYMMGKNIRTRLDHEELFLMYYYYLNTPGSCYYYKQQKFYDPDKLMSFVLKELKPNKFPNEFIYLNEDILFLSWIKGIEEREVPA